METKFYRTYKKFKAIDSALEMGIITSEEHGAYKDILNEYYYDSKGLVQFVYDYMRDNQIPYVQIDKEELKKAFSNMVDECYYLIDKRSFLQS